MECENCGSEDISLNQSGTDFVHECHDCGEIIENGVCVRRGADRGKFVELDVWLYPRDLDGRNIIVNLFREEEGQPIQINEYKLPDDWREQCVPKGNKSVHDIMEEV